MAKKATTGGSGPEKKKPAAKSRAKSKPATPKRRSNAASKAKTGQKQQSQQQQDQSHGAAETLIKVLESPLVVDLIAVGATAALAAIAEQKFGRRPNDSDVNRSTAKAAGKAAAAAIGRRISTEVEEILKATKKARDSE